MRYLTHGNFTYNFHSLSIVYISEDYMTQEVKLRVAASAPRLYIDKNTVALTSQNFIVSSETVTKLLGSRRGQQKKTRAPPVICKLCSIPAFVFSLVHSKEDVRDKYVNLPSAHVVPPVVTNNSPFRPDSAASGTVGTDSVESNQQRPFDSLGGGTSSSSSSSTSSKHYSHHDVYLRPALLPSILLDRSPGSLTLDECKYIANDKYYYFRSHEMTSRWEIEMRLADNNDEPICFNLRLDQLMRIMVALRPAGAASSDDTAPAPTAADKGKGKNGGTSPGGKAASSRTAGKNASRDRAESAELSLEEDAGRLDKISDYNYGVARPIALVSMGDMISQLKLQLILNKIMISSWPSAQILGGIVVTVGSSDMQLRMLRDIPKEYLTKPAPMPAPVRNSRGKKKTVSMEDAAASPNNANLEANLVYPLKIDHFIMDTAFIEVYARTWQLFDPVTKRASVLRSLDIQPGPGG
jgi:hypothetical protein